MHTDQHGWKRGGCRGTLFARRLRVLECGDWSPLLRRRLVAVKLPRASAHACVPALARAVSAPPATDVSRNSTATSRLGKAVTSHRTPKLAPLRLLLRRAVFLRVHPWFSFRVQVQSLPQPPMLSRYQSLRKFVPSAPGSPAPSPQFGTEARAGERRRFAMETRLASVGHPSPRPSPRSCLTGRGRRPRYSLRRLRHKLSQRLITA